MTLMHRSCAAYGLRVAPAIRQVRDVTATTTLGAQQAAAYKTAAAMATQDTSYLEYGVMVLYVSETRSILACLQVLASQFTDSRERLLQRRRLYELHPGLRQDVDIMLICRIWTPTDPSLTAKSTQTAATATVCQAAR